MNIKYPVRLTPEYQIMDADNKVVVPELCWRNNAEHLKQQGEIGDLIVTLFNKHGINTIEKAVEAGYITSLPNEKESEVVVKKGPGRPRKA